MTQAPERQSIQEIEDVIQRARDVIEQTRRQIPQALQLIREYILDGASSGDPIKDLLYLLRTDAIASPGLFQALTILHAELTAHAGEFIVVELIDLVQTFQPGPHDTRVFPPVEQKTYRVGLIPATTPLTAIIHSRFSETEGLQLNLLHAESVELPILFLAQLEKSGECSKDAFSQNGCCEPGSIVFGNNALRFWIGSERVSRCLYQTLFSDKTKGKQLRSDILAIVDQLSPPIPNFEELSKELSRLQRVLGESNPVEYAAT